MHHKATKDTKEEANRLSREVLGAALEGPGLLESAYEECLAYELALRKLSFQKQKSLPLRYKAVSLDCGYRLDFLVEGLVVVELKSVEQLLPTQMLTYLRMSSLRLGLLLDFNVRLFKLGIRRLVN